MDVDNGNLLVFSFPVYALLDPGSTLSMVTPFMANQFDLLPEIRLAMSSGGSRNLRFWVL